jgi:hypothetical protein
VREKSAYPAINGINVPTAIGTSRTLVFMRCERGPRPSVQIRNQKQIWAFNLAALYFVCDKYCTY